VTSAEHLHLTLDLELSPDSVRGHLVEPDGFDQPFWGWLALVAAVETARDRSLRAGRTPPSPTDVKEEPLP
jgi:hypothetical protein